MGKVILITGGARSGKSAYALETAARLAGPAGRRAFIATLEPRDLEMAERVARHRAERGPEWETHEEPLEVGTLIAGLADSGFEAVLLDCLTLWLSNLMHAGRNVQAEGRALIDALENARRKSHVVLVTNEVGMGIVPEGEFARRFRDLAGSLNRNVAVAADEVYLVVAGMPVRIKP